MQGYFGGQRLGDASDLSLPQVFRYLYVFFYTVFNLHNLLYIIPAVHLSPPVRFILDYLIRFSK